MRQGRRGRSAPVRPRPSRRLRSPTRRLPGLARSARRLICRRLGRPASCRRRRRAIRAAPAPCRRRCRRPIRPRTNTTSPTATFCTRITRSRPKASVASCANIRAITWRRRLNTGSAKVCSSNSNIATPPKSFLAVSTKYETTARAPEALLRLGQSLAALGEKEAACASLGEVLRKYPRASSSVKQAVDREQKRGHC